VRLDHLLSTRFARPEHAFKVTSRVQKNEGQRGLLSFCGDWFVRNRASRGVTSDKFRARRDRLGTERHEAAGDTGAFQISNCRLQIDGPDAELGIWAGDDASQRSKGKSQKAKR
jgi:hypothetical protein